MMLSAFHLGNFKWPSKFCLGCNWVPKFNLGTRR
jgi:hypothetical protein